MRISWVAFATVITCAMLGAGGCAERLFQSNVFGQYTLSQAHEQYAELFQMQPNRYEKFLTFENGWWKADVRKMREMGIDVGKLCRKYCRTANIRVPFPLFVDYELLRGSG